MHRRESHLRPEADEREYERESNRVRIEPGRGVPVCRPFRNVMGTECGRSCGVKNDDAHQADRQAARRNEDVLPRGFERPVGPLQAHQQRGDDGRDLERHPKARHVRQQRHDDFGTGEGIGKGEEIASVPLAGLIVFAFRRNVPSRVQSDRTIDDRYRKQE